MSPSSFTHYRSQVASLDKQHIKASSRRHLTVARTLPIIDPLVIAAKAAAARLSRDLDLIAHFLSRPRNEGFKLESAPHSGIFEPTMPYKVFAALIAPAIQALRPYARNKQSAVARSIAQDALADAEAVGERIKSLADDYWRFIINDDDDANSFNKDN